MAMNASRTDTVRGLWDELNQGLFPWIDDNIGELDAAHRLFMAVCEAVVRPGRVRLREMEGKRTSACQPPEDIQGVPPQGRTEREGHEGARADAPGRAPVTQALRMGQPGARPVAVALQPRVRRIRRMRIHGRVVRRDDRQIPRRLAAVGIFSRHETVPRRNPHAVQPQRGRQCLLGRRPSCAS